jgi:general stress protein 26
MLEQIKTLLRRQDSCVLATVDGEKPHCSLMAYTLDDMAERIFLITPRDTKKYRNLKRHPSVSLLIDTRGDGAHEATQALTVAGHCKVLQHGDEISEVKALFAERHTRLQDFLQKDDLAVVCVTIESFLLLTGPERAHYESLQHRITSRGGNLNKPSTVNPTVNRGG